MIDVDGNRFVDYVCSWGPADPRPRPPRGARRGRRGGRAGARASARPRPPRSSWRRRSRARMDGVEMLRMTSSGTEATMTAVRLARAATGRERLRQVRRRLSRARRRPARGGRLGACHPGAAPRAPGVPASAAADTIVIPWNDPDALRRGDSRGASWRRSSPSRCRPTWAWSRRRRASSSCCASCADASGALLDPRRGHQRLPGRPRRRPGADGRARRPDDDRQGHRRRAARRGGRRRAPS